jgi:pilus assembly protein Flp/PilA
MIGKFLKDEAGASAVEYALLIGFIASAIAAAVTALGANLINPFTTVTGKL